MFGISKSTINSPLRNKLWEIRKGFKLPFTANSILHQAAKSSMYIDESLLQFSKAFFSIFCTDFPIYSDLSEVQ